MSGSVLLQNETTITVPMYYVINGGASQSIPKKGHFHAVAANHFGDMSALGIMSPGVTASPGALLVSSGESLTFSQQTPITNSDIVFNINSTFDDPYNTLLYMPNLNTDQHYELTKFLLVPRVSDTADQYFAGPTIHDGSVITDGSPSGYLPVNDTIEFNVPTTRLGNMKMTVYNGARMYNNNMFIVGDSPSMIAYKYPTNDMKISGNSGSSIVAPDGTLIAPPSGSSSFSLASVSQPTFTSPTTSAVYVQTDCTKGSETINLGLKRFMWSNIWAIGAGVEMYYYQVPSVFYVCLQPSDNTYNFNVDFVGVYDKTNQTEYGQYKRRPGVVTDAYIECVSDVWRMRLGGTNDVDSSGTIWYENSNGNSFDLKVPPRVGWNRGDKMVIECGSIPDQNTAGNFQLRAATASIVISTATLTSTDLTITLINFSS